MYNRMRQSPDFPGNRRSLKSLAFADDEYYLHLQAADLLSWIVRVESLYKFHGEDYSLRALFTEINTASPEFKLELRPDSGAKVISIK
jgi:hypothetical protein